MPNKNSNEKVFSVIISIAVSVIIGWLVLSSYGVFNNFLSWDAEQAGFWWKVPGTILLLIASFFFVGLVTNKYKDGIAGGIAVALLVIFSVCFNVGFKFTAGDIKQRVSFINLDGKIDNVPEFKKYYGSFYKLDTDTALSNYIDKYHELPGVNYWAYNICCAPVETRHPKSTAPRANEDFQWHTGAYEPDNGKLPK